jgi:hypothetical protein
MFQQCDEPEQPTYHHNNNHSPRKGSRAECSADPAQNVAKTDEMSAPPKAMTGELHGSADTMIGDLQRSCRLVGKGETKA